MFYNGTFSEQLLKIVKRTKLSSAYRFATRTSFRFPLLITMAVIHFKSSRIGRCRFNKNKNMPLKRGLLGGENYNQIISYHSNYSFSFDCISILRICHCFLNTLIILEIALFKSGWRYDETGRVGVPVRNYIFATRRCAE